MPHNVVPAPFQSPRIPSARHTCRTASKNPLTLSVLNTPLCHTHTISCVDMERANEDMLRTQGTCVGWQHVFRGGWVKRGWGGCVCNRVFTTSKGVTANVCTRLECVMSTRTKERYFTCECGYCGPRSCSDKFCLEWVHGCRLASCHWKWA